jgi:hypothetical protein
MLPAIWGPKTWYLLHIITIQPKRKSEDYHRFFSNLQYLLPCAKCRNSYKEHLVALPVPKGKTELARWFIQLHNRVNESVKQPLENEEDMLSYWKKQHDTVLHYPLETTYLEVASYFIHGHPGYYRMTPEFITAHVLFWKLMLEFLPKKSAEKEKIQEWMIKHPLSEDIIRYKSKYLVWFETLQKETGIYFKKVPYRCRDACKL